MSLRDGVDAMTAAGVPPARAGVGLRARHVAELLAARPAVPWLEVHPENYMAGGAALTSLEAVRREYPIALHGVGLSLGSAGAIDGGHLARLAALVDRIEPCLVSEHLSWSTTDGAYLNSLLPLPYTEESLAVMAEHVHEVQDALGRSILVENPSSYLRFRHSTIEEPDFLGELVRRTGCGLLCDINNVYVSARNLGFAAAAYLDALPADAVSEIHLAGHAENEADGRPMLIDDHGSPVAPPVWDLFRHAIRRFGPVPTLIEWDTDVPALSALLSEARIAEDILGPAREYDGARAA